MDKIKGKAGRKPFQDRGKIITDIRIYIPTWQVERMGGKVGAETAIKAFINNYCNG